MLTGTAIDPSGGAWKWYRRADGRYQVNSAEVPTYGFALTMTELADSVSESMAAVLADIEATTPTIRTDDGKSVAEGDRVYDYYNLGWGTIRVGSLDSDGWFYVDHEDGSCALLNGARIATYQPQWTKQVGR